MDDYERKIRTRLRDDFPHYANKCLSIRTKSGDIVPFRLNRTQLHLHEVAESQKRAKGFVRIITVKGRQMGISTYTGARYYHQVTHRQGCRAFILTHAADATNNLFQMTKLFYDMCPTVVRPQLESSNAKELSFGFLKSGYKIGTAGNSTVGRSQTIQLLHASEVAFWDHAADHAKGILQSVPRESGTEIFMESTANGVGNYFHEQWQLAEAGYSDFIPVFLPWYWQQEYRRELDDNLTLNDEEYELVQLYDLDPLQISWRRAKITELSAGGIDGRKAFLQEYPNTSIDAFQTSGEDNFISPDIVMRARKHDVGDVRGPLIVGVDPARFGDDRTSIIRRIGRKAFRLQSYVKKDGMEIAGICHRIIVDEQPDRLFIDIGGLGAPIYDRLLELGHADVVVGVNFGSTPLNQDRYINKRAECWGLAHEWLRGNLPVQIPDVDSLHADLCGIKYKIDSQSRLVMEKAEDMKRRGIRSPDEATALILTFAEPVEYKENLIAKSKDKAAKVMSNFVRQQMHKDKYGTSR